MSVTHPTVVLNCGDMKPCSSQIPNTKCTAEPMFYERHNVDRILVACCCCCFFCDKIVNGQQTSSVARMGQKVCSPLCSRKSKAPGRHGQNEQPHTPFGLKHSRSLHIREELPVETIPRVYISAATHNVAVHARIVSRLECLKRMADMMEY